MKLYETVFIVRQDATQAQVESLAQDYAKIIRSFGGDVLKTEFCGLRTLAYKIKKNRKGHYVLMNISADHKAVLEMERIMKINESLLRTLTVRVESHDPNPSALIQQKNFQMDKARSYDDQEESGYAAKEPYTPRERA